MTDALRPLHERMEAWVAAGCPTGEQEYLSQDDLFEYHRERGKRDLFFFGKYVFGFDWLEPEVHAPLAYAWQVPSGHMHAGKVYGDTRMAQLARTSLKTTLLTQSYAAWMIANDPEHRGLIFTHGYEFACKVIGLIRARFEGRGPRGKFFNYCYPELIPPKAEREKWKENMLIVRRSDSYTDATLEASGVGAGITGGHFTFQGVDDLQDDRLNRTQLDKIKSTYDNLTPMLLAGGQRRITATRWGFNDVTVYIEKAHPRCLVALRQFEENGAMVFKSPYPDKIREEAYALKRRNPYLFSCWYMNHPADEDSEGFKRAWFRYHRQRGNDIVELDLEGRETRKIDIAACNCFIFVDPLTGREKSAGATDDPSNDPDFVGIIVLHVGKDNLWYITRAIRKRWPVDRVIDELFMLNDYYKPKKICIEQRGAQYLYNHVLLTEFKRRGKVFSIDDWQGGAASKEVRIASLMPRYHNGMIFHRDAENAQIAEEIATLETELLDFPTSSHDDASDALSAAGPKAWAPGQLTPAEGRAKFKEDAELAKLDSASRREARAYMNRMRGEHKSEFWASA